ncbi:MAG: response regulator transcription factor [Deltaproteobacteria bacterium]|nr:response regulator transcription factor [Deltaproteobacteria bacterium]MBI3391381.1 response regulator transcription factor [Deltaproteobacteria bacterium]
MRILVVEDEKKVASFIQRALTAEHYRVDAEGDGEAGLARALAGDYDLVILDIMLPKRDGLAVLRELRARGSTIPVMLLTARAALSDKVSGLDLGADDYLAKPFAIDELLARVRAILRRGAPAAPPILSVADLSLDPATRRVTRADRLIELTAKEYALLEFFLRNRGRVLSRSLIAEHVWGVSFDTFTNVIDVYVNYLRRKIDADFTPKLLHTVRGAGYVLKTREG